MTATLVDNLYVVKNGNGTIDTMQCRDLRMVKWIANATSSPRGGVKEVVQISVLENLDLDSTELSFDYKHSMN